MEILKSLWCKLFFFKYFCGPLLIKSLASGTWYEKNLNFSLQNSFRFTSPSRLPIQELHQLHSSTSSCSLTLNEFLAYYDQEILCRSMSFQNNLFLIMEHSCIFRSWAQIQKTFQTDSPLHKIQKTIAVL